MATIAPAAAAHQEDAWDEAVNSLAKEARDALAAALHWEKQAKALEARVRELEAQEPKVLEKVASATDADHRQARRIADAMVERDLIEEDFRTKIASDLVASPFGALEHLERLIFGIAPVSSPRGVSVEKQASRQAPASPSVDLTGWFEPPQRA